MQPLYRISDLVTLTGAEIKPSEWPAVEQSVCAQASVLMLNRYSPLSSVLWERAVDVSRRNAVDAQRPVDTAKGASPAVPVAPRPPRRLYWRRTNSDTCIPLFTRTARFDIQPNRFGILGQFGANRKLQLMTTNLSHVVGWDGRLLDNASIELEVYVSNEQHTLTTFEYTKENNQKGVQFTLPVPTGGWRDHTWQLVSVPLSERHYSFPSMTPWDRMDRLELYYSSPSSQQQLGDYIRLRNVYVRSTRSFRGAIGADGSEGGQGSDSSQTSRPCREVEYIQRLRKRRAKTHEVLLHSASQFGRRGPQLESQLSTPDAGDHSSLATDDHAHSEELLGDSTVATQTSTSHDLYKSEALKYVLVTLVVGMLCAVGYSTLREQQRVGKLRPAHDPRTN